MSTLILVFIFITTLLVLFRTKSNFPGPPRLPFIGSIPWLKMKRGRNDWVLLPEVTKHKVAFVQVGLRLKLHIINDFKIAKDIFSLDVFSHRNIAPEQRAHRFLDPSRPSGIIFNNGEGWNNQRRFGLRTLRDFGFGKQSLENTMNVEIDEMIQNFASQKGDVKIGSDFNIPVINILWQMVAGYRILPEDREGIQLVESVTKNFVRGNSHFQILPSFFIKMFPNLTGYSDRIQWLDGMRMFMLKIIDQHDATFDPEHLRDFIDVYLLQMREDTQDKYTKGDLVAAMMDFFAAGTETSSTTLKWALLFLAINPECQHKCREEIKRVIGDSRPEVIHMQQLPYTMATLTEIQRVSCVAPMTLSHVTTKEFTYNEYTFPKGAVCFTNISYIMKDPAYFKEPHTFNPSRFLDDQGNFVRNERVIPFGIGKRFCMGELLARNEIFLFTVNFLQHLEILPPQEHPGPDPSRYTANLTNIPTDYHIRFKSLN